MADKLDHSQRGKARTNAIISVISVAGIIILLQFFLSPKLFGRIDLTESQFHTLSDASKEAASALEDVVVRVYISEELPDKLPVPGGQRVALRTVAQSFRDKLEEYQAFSDGNLRLEYVNDDIEEQAAAAKLQLFSSEEGRVSGGRLELAEYALGATFHYRNVKEVMPLALNPEAYEFEVTRILLRLRDKYDKSQAMKTLLDDGKALFEATGKCNDAVQSAAKEDSDPTAGDDGLKGLIAAAESAGGKIEELKRAKEDFSKVCTELDDLMASKGDELRKRNNDYLNIFLRGVTEFQKTYEALIERLDTDDEQLRMQALEVRDILDAVYREVDRDHENLINSPGQRKVGFVCGHGEFCPFASSKPVVDPQMGALLGNNNPMVQQIMGQVAQIEQQINQVNGSINQNLFKRRGFDIGQVDLSERVPDDVYSLVLMGPTRPFTSRELYHLDQFALSGRPVVVLVDRWDVSIQNIKPPENLGDEEQLDYTAISENPFGLQEILKHYGVEVGQDLVAEPSKNEVMVVSYTTTRGRLRWQTQKAFPYPLLPTFENLSTDNVLLRNVSNVTLPYSVSVSLTDEAKGVSGDDQMAEELVKSSPQAVVIAKGEFSKFSTRFDPASLKASIDSFERDGETPVMAMLQRKVDSYFKGKEIPKANEGAEVPGEEAEEEPEAPDLRRTDAGAVKLLVVGSNLGLEGLNAAQVLEGFDIASMAQNNMDIMQQLPVFGSRLQNWQVRISQVSELLQDNIRLMFNIMDWSIQNEALVEIRSKGYTNRPLEQVDEGQQRFYTYANIFGVPLLFLLFGGIRHFAVRTRRSKMKA